MTGNIIGEPLDPQLVEEINIRQKAHGSGFASKRTPQQIQFLNNRNAWFKLASSVEILDGGVETLEDGTSIQLQDGLPRLKEIGIETPEQFLGKQMAQKTVLFNLMSELELDSKNNFKQYVRRSGISRQNTLWNNSSVYGLGDNPSPSTPAPGIKSVTINCLNRGSIKEASISLTAYNKFQFELIELMYLRLGFSMMLEWGFNQFLDDKGAIQQVGNTLIEENWFTENKVKTPIGVLKEIKQKQLEYQFNYDGFYGKVVNFDWEFTPSGTYEITLKLITVGDVIESISANPSSVAIPVEQVNEEIEDASSNSKIGQLKNDESAIIAKAGLSTMNFFLYEKVKTTNWDELPSQSNYYSWMNSIKANNPTTVTEKYPTIKDGIRFNYFITLGELLKEMFSKCSPTIGEDDEQILSIDNIEATSKMSTFPNLVSLDPRVCLIKPTFQSTPNSNLLSLKYPAYFNDLKDFTGRREKDGVIYGNLMNIYVNFEFVANILATNVNEEESKLSIFKFLKQLCKGINRALGHTCKLQPVIKDDRIVTIIDQNPIPGLIPDQVIPNIEVFGFNEKDNTSNFVKDISFKTEITPDLATMLSIGATAGNSTTKETDGTAFSKWNEGLRDRFIKKLKDPPTNIRTNPTNQELIDKAWEEGKPISGVRKFFKNVGSWFTGDDYDADKDQNKTVKYKNKTVRDVNELEFRQRAEEIDRQIEAKKANERVTMEKLEKQFSSNYYLYLARCFGGTVNVTTNDFNNQDFTLAQYKTTYTKISPDFINEGINSYSGYKNTVNNLVFKLTKKPSNQIGFIPVKLNLKIDGLGGVKIYNGIKVTTKVLPSNYNEKLRFIITKVDHSIESNDWVTTLETLSIPPTEVSKLQTSPFLQFDSSPQNSIEADEIIVTGPLTDPNVPFKIIDNRGEVDSINNDGLRKEITKAQLLSIINRDAQPEFSTFLNALESKYQGYTMLLNAVYRTFERSQQLRRQNSRNALPGKSKHNYSGAIDFNITDPNGRTFRKSERAIWIQSGIVEESKNAGLGWGGGFSNYVDSIHFFKQFDSNVALANAQEENQGKPQRDWDTRNTKLS